MKEVGDTDKIVIRLDSKLLYSLKARVCVGDSLRCF